MKRGCNVGVRERMRTSVCTGRDGIVVISEGNRHGWGERQHNTGFNGLVLQERLWLVAMWLQIILLWLLWLLESI